MRFWFVTSVFTLAFNMCAGLLTAICLFVGIIVVNGGFWSEWYDLTVCSAIPCKCKGYDEKCTPGKKVMIRSCIYDEADTSVCQYDKGGIGAIKVVDPCYNEGVCPGWSTEWVPQGKCQCETEKRLEKRFCNNPSPIYPEDVKCWDDDTDEEAMVLEREGNCTCTEEELKAMQTTMKTTSTTAASTTLLPCCEVEDEFNYYDIDVNKIDFNKTEPTTTTTQNPEPAKLSELDKEYADYYNELVGELPPDCRQCNEDSGDSRWR